MSDFRASRRRLYAFILSCVANEADAADIMQETSLLLWEKYDSFESGTDFTAWAVAVARHRVLKLRSRRFDRRVRFDSDMLERIAGQTGAWAADMDLRSRIVQDCVRKLPAKDAELVVLKYDKGMKTIEIATSQNRPLQGLYKTMARIHRNLRECVGRNLKKAAADE